MLNEFKIEKIQELSGFMVIVNNKILLVKPKKFKGIEHMWSIPKGKVEGKKFKSALKELKEETGIELDTDIKVSTEKVNIFYKKSGQLKKLIVYVIELNETELTHLRTTMDNKCVDEWGSEFESIDHSGVLQEEMYVYLKCWDDETPIDFIKI